MDGYKEASLVNKRINRLLAEVNITSDNALEWLHFTRTITMELQYIEKLAEDELFEYYQSETGTS